MRVLQVHEGRIVQGHLRRVGGLRRRREGGQGGLRGEVRRADRRAAGLHDRGPEVLRGHAGGIQRGRRRRRGRPPGLAGRSHRRREGGDGRRHQEARARAQEGVKVDDLSE